MTWGPVLAFGARRKTPRHGIGIEKALQDCYRRLGLFTFGLHTRQDEIVLEPDRALPAPEPCSGLEIESTLDPINRSPSKAACRAH